MEGVAEQSIVGLAAGLALEKFRPYVNTIATFIQEDVTSKLLLTCVFITCQ